MFQTERKGKSISSKRSKPLYMVLTENLLLPDSFIRSLSSIQGLIFFLWIEERNISISSISQSLKDLRKVGDQPPSSLKQFHRSATITSFCTVRINIEGSKEHNASSPHQTSFQKLILLPSPKEKATFWRKRGHSFYFLPQPNTKATDEYTFEQ